jgi:hypothetical protein
VPRRLFPKALASLRSCIWRRLRGQKARAFEYELWLCFFAGLARQCIRERSEGFGEGVIGPVVVPDAGADAADELSRSVHASPTTGAGLI